MPVQPMTFYPYADAHTINFRVKLDCPETLDLLAFVGRLESKFDGKITDRNGFSYVPGREFADFKVKFEYSTPFIDALNLCKKELDTKGRVRARFKGNLDGYDHGRLLSSRLLARIKALKSDDDATDLDSPDKDQGPSDE